MLKGMHAARALVIKIEETPNDRKPNLTATDRNKLPQPSRRLIQQRNALTKAPLEKARQKKKKKTSNAGKRSSTRAPV
jgi:hypothetical protein